MDQKPVTVADLTTPFWLDKAFILVAVHMIAAVLFSTWHIALNEQIVTADLYMVITYIVAHKGKTLVALWQLIRSQAMQRYTASAPPQSLSDVAKRLDAPPNA